MAQRSASWIAFAILLMGCGGAPDAGSGADGARAQPHQKANPQDLCVDCGGGGDDGTGDGDDGTGGGDTGGDDTGGDDGSGDDGSGSGSDGACYAACANWCAYSIYNRIAYLDCIDNCASYCSNDRGGVPAIRRPNAGIPRGAKLPVAVPAR
jgi:hypothetical protein